MRRADPRLVSGIAIIAAWLLLAFGAPFLSPVGPLAARYYVLEPGGRFVTAPFEPGYGGYPLGSDRQGRDLWVNLMYGARTTLTIAGAVLAARLLLGVLLGVLAGWHARRPLDRALSTVMDAFAAFPTLIFAAL